VLLLVLPPATLGQFSATKRSNFAGSGIATAVGDISTGELSMIDVAAAQTSKEGELALAKRAGEAVDFVGVVSRYGATPADERLGSLEAEQPCATSEDLGGLREQGLGRSWRRRKRVGHERSEPPPRDEGPGNLELSIAFATVLTANPSCSASARTVGSRSPGP